MPSRWSWGSVPTPCPPLADRLTGAPVDDQLSRLRLTPAGKIVCSYPPSGRGVTAHVSEPSSSRTPIITTTMNQPLSHDAWVVTCLGQCRPERSAAGTQCRRNAVPPERSAAGTQCRRNAVPPERSAAGTQCRRNADAAGTQCRRNAVPPEREGLTHGAQAVADIETALRRQRTQGAQAGNCQRRDVRRRIGGRSGGGPARSHPGNGWAGTCGPADLRICGPWTR